MIVMAEVIVHAFWRSLGRGVFRGRYRQIRGDIDDVRLRDRRHAYQLHLLCFAPLQRPLNCRHQSAERQGPGRSDLVEVAGL